MSKIMHDKEYDCTHAQYQPVYFSTNFNYLPHHDGGQVSKAMCSCICNSRGFAGQHILGIPASAFEVFAP